MAPRGWSRDGEGPASDCSKVVVDVRRFHADPYSSQGATEIASEGRNTRAVNVGHQCRPTVSAVVFDGSCVPGLTRPDRL